MDGGAITVVGNAVWGGDYEFGLMLKRYAVGRWCVWIGDNLLSRHVSGSSRPTCGRDFLERVRGKPTTKA